MIEAQRLLAANPATAPEVLRELSQSDDRAIRQAVAGNPNVPIEVFWKLLMEFPSEIIKNPIFPLIRLENPSWLEMIPIKQLSTMLEKPDSYNAFIPIMLEQYTDYSDRGGIRDRAIKIMASRADVSIDWLEEIVLKDERLYRPVIGHPKIKITSFQKFAQNRNLQVILAIVCLRCEEEEDERGNKINWWPQHLNNQEVVNMIIGECIRNNSTDGTGISTDATRILFLEYPLLSEEFMYPLIKKLSNESKLFLKKSPKTLPIVLQKLAEMKEEI
jgi:hypothetical protein